jgi:S-layer protein (TIGR01564 family)
MDVVSATMIAAKVGTMTYTEQPGEVTFTKVYKAVHENIDPFLTQVNIGNFLNIPWMAQIWGLGFPTVDVPDSSPYLVGNSMLLPSTTHWVHCTSMTSTMSTGVMVTSTTIPGRLTRKSRSALMTSTTPRTTCS